MSKQNKTNKTESQNTSNQTQNHDSKNGKYPERENAGAWRSPVFYVRASTGMYGAWMSMAR